MVLGNHIFLDKKNHEIYRHVEKLAASNQTFWNVDGFQGKGNHQAPNIMIQGSLTSLNDDITADMAVTFDHVDI